VSGVVKYLFDGLQNFVSGVGTQKDKSANWTHVYNPLTRDQVDAIYSSDWLARKIVDIVAYDMTREWRTWQSDFAEDMYAAEKALRVRTLVRKALTYARLYGGSAIMIGDGSLNPSKPLVLDRMGVGGIKYLHVFTRDDLEEVDGSVVEDVNSPDLGKTMLYRLRDRRGGRSDVTVHRSRLAFFCGPEAPADQVTANGWGHSVYDSVLKAVINVNAAASNAAAMTEEAKIDVIRVPDLHKLLSTQSGTDALLRRWSLANTLKSTVNTLLIGNEEEFTRKEMNFGGLPDLIRTHLEIVSGAADVPLTRLLGQSPAGLNATGESDIRNYYDMLRSRQTTELEESTWPLDEALKRHVTGASPDELVYEWVPLWQLSEAERADIAQKKMSAVTQLSALNLFLPTEMRPAVFDMLMQDGFLATMDAHLQDDADFEAEILEQKELEQAAVAPPEGERPKLRVVGGDADPFGIGDVGAWSSSPDFDESEHPRVKSGPGAGQFAPKPKTLEEVATKSYTVAASVEAWWARFKKYVQQKPNGTSNHRWFLSKIMEEGEVRGLVNPSMKAEMGKQIGWSFFIQAQKVKEKGGSASTVAALEKKALSLGFDVGAEKLGMAEEPIKLVPSPDDPGDYEYQKHLLEEEKALEAAEKKPFADPLKPTAKQIAEEKALLENEKTKAGTLDPDSIEAAEEIAGKWTKYGEQKGSNPGGFYADDKGNKWYVKIPKTKANVQADLLANRLYSIVGAAVPYERPVKVNGAPAIASAVLAQNAMPLNTFNANGQAQAAMELRKNFAADAWLANWDVVGLAKDNVLIDDAGNVWRVDQGGTLMYRAQGELKPFPSMKVDEWDTLRDPNLNPQSASVFAGMSDEELSKSIDRVLAVPDEVIKKAAEDAGMEHIGQRLIDRKTVLKAKQEMLQAKVKKVTPIPPPDQLTGEQKKAVKTTPVQLAFLHAGAIGTPEVMAKIETFNAAWSGKVLSSMEELDQKVKAFNELKASINDDVLKSVATNEKKTLAAASGNIDKLVEQFGKGDPAARKNLEALAGVAGSDMTHAKYFLNHAHEKLASLKVEGQEKLTTTEAALVASYTGQYYSDVNAQLRYGSVSPQQYAYARALNRALKKLPAFKGTVYRKATLPASEFAKYKPGYAVEERHFTSTSTSEKTWHGNHRWTIKSLTGRKVKQISVHGHEQEVLFPMRTEFVVTKVEGNHVYMEEINPNEDD
jgi:uncharacterized protein